MLAPEGRGPVLVGVALAAAAHAGIGALAGLPFWIGAAGLAWVYREPRARVPSTRLGVLSPVDGRVLAARECRDPWLEREATRIGLRVRWPGIAPLRSPTEARVEDCRFAAEPFRQASFCGAGRRMAESHALWLRTDEGDDVAVVVSSVTRWMRLHAQLHIGDRLGHGQRCGFVHLASRVDLLLPRAVRIVVEPGQRARAGETVLAQLVHKRVGVRPAGTGAQPGQEA
jgi:phosphatidylserine decarboxylase